MSLWKRMVAVAACAFLLGGMTVMAAGDVVTGASERNHRKLADGVTLTELTGEANGKPQVMYTVIADGAQYGLRLGGTVRGRQLVQDMTDGVAAQDGVKEVLAGINGDHFSFKTGVPLGFSMSGGELFTDDTPPEPAEEYDFYTLGLRDDHTAMIGVNPVVLMDYTVNGQTFSIDRLNRTRETWESGQLCLYTDRWGESTHASVGGREVSIRVDSGSVSPGETLIGEVVAVSEDGDAALDEKTVVLSASAPRMDDLLCAVGDKVEMTFAFEDEAWNGVTFAVGGHHAIVEDGEPVILDYQLDVFADPSPRTALGVRQDGELVIVTVDGRSDQSGGLSANQMAQYMAEDMDCEQAILLDGGGSTALVAAEEDGSVSVANVPSEERPVGNGVFLVTLANAPTSGLSLPLLIALIALIVVVVVAGAGIIIGVYLKRKK